MNVRDRILESAYELFSTQGVKGTGISAIIAHAGVARMSLYQHFRSKDDLVIEFLKLRERRFNTRWQDRIRNSKISPENRLLMVFDQLTEWFNTSDFEGSSFIKVLMEEKSDGPVYRAAVRHIENIKLFVHELADAAKICDAAAFADLWTLLIHGAIVEAQAGNRDSARLAKMAGAVLLKNWPPPSG
ncbi:MAG: TetR/AcrR family transcriptional regulator [Stellaceae bacterium]